MKKLILTVALMTPLTGLAADQMPLPESIETEEFQSVLVKVGEDLYIAGQPSQAGLKWMQELGVTTVINLRTQKEMDSRERVPFDEAMLVEELKMQYVHIPSGGPDTPYIPEMVEEFAEALRGANGRVLLHCTVAWRASHLYATYLHRNRGLSLDEAVGHAQKINFGSLPLEGFLGEPLSIRIADQPTE
ncbi:MAG: hypothetical protein GY906_33135 [bacterium]|nr:hypothetical protein [bacterium]